MQGEFAMSGVRMSKRGLSLAVSGTIAMALLAGCAGHSKFAAKAGAVTANADAKSGRKDDRSVAKAEEAVANKPGDAPLRVALGHAYLAAGRFDSAASAFNDAMTLGDQSGRTALSLALSEVGAGQPKDAVAILDDWRDAIAPEDLGLALALAGETGRGVAVLADTLRSGADSPKVRQNLAYAYALDGRWSEARVMASQDLSVDQLDSRISDWATTGRAEDYAKRVANLLGTKVADDPGQPERLALADTAGQPQLAAATAVAPASAAVAAAELPPVAQTAAVAVDVAPSPVPVEVFAAAPAPAPTPVPAEVFAAAPAPAVKVAEPAPLAPTQSQSFAAAFAAQPVVQDAPAPRTIKVPFKAARAAVQPRPAASPRVATSGTHQVQLGAFSSAQGARRAWGTFTARNPELRGTQPVITQAVVNGRNFWRVAASGFDAGSARSLCSSVKNRGGVCFAYAASARPVPGMGAAGPARARR